MRIPLLLLLVAGCSSVTDAPGDDARLTDPPETVEAYADDRAELVARLDATIGEARASRTSACRVVEVGEKACGGPSSYRVYSVGDGDPEAVETLAAEIAALDRYANREFGLFSTCDLPARPTPVLVEGRCQAR